MKHTGIFSKLFGQRNAAPPRPSEAGPGPHIPEPLSAPPQHGGQSPHEDLERAARGFVEEHEPLIGKAGPEVLARVFTQGANIFTTITPEEVAAAKTAEEAKRALTAAIWVPSTPATEYQEALEEEARASAVYASLKAATRDLGDFLDRVRGRLPDVGSGG